MSSILNLDLNNRIKTTDYGYQLELKPLPSILLSISKDDYNIDYEKLEYIQLAVKHDLSMQVETFRLDKSNIINSENGTFIEWKLTDSLLAKKEKLVVNTLIRYDNYSYPILEFKIVIFEDYYPETLAITQAIDMYNNLYRLFLNLVKRKEIGQPLGLIPLDNKAKLSIDYFDSKLVKHIDIRLFDTLNIVSDIHGLRINKTDYQLEYYHSSDDEWYQANSIHGGKFGYDNNISPDYDVFGGNFTDESVLISGGKLDDDSNEFIDASILSENINVAYSGGQFKDNLPSITGGYFGSND